MPTYVTVILLCLILMIISVFSVLIYSLVKKMQESYQKVMFQNDRQIYQKDKTIQDLMNRLMSPDPKTFQILTNSSNQMMDQTLISGYETISMSDQAEAARHAALIHNAPGEPLYDEQYEEAVMDLGIRNY